MLLLQALLSEQVTASSEHHSAPITLLVLCLASQSFQLGQRPNRIHKQSRALATSLCEQLPPPPGLKDYAWKSIPRLFVSLFLFRDTVSLCSSGCSGTCFSDKTGLKLRGLPASASRFALLFRSFLSLLQLYSGCSSSWIALGRCLPGDTDPPHTEMIC